MRLDNVPPVCATDPHDVTMAYRPKSVETSVYKGPSDTTTNQRFMASLLTAETCAKLEPEDGTQTNYRKLLDCISQILFVSLFLFKFKFIFKVDCLQKASVASLC